LEGVKRNSKLIAPIPFMKIDPNKKINTVVALNIFRLVSKQISGHNRQKNCDGNEDEAHEY